MQKCVSLATKDANPTVLQEREELRDVIIATQESAVVQLLLELCLPTEEDQVWKLLNLFLAGGRGGSNTLNAYA